MREFYTLDILLEFEQFSGLVRPSFNVCSKNGNRLVSLFCLGIFWDALLCICVLLIHLISTVAEVLSVFDNDKITEYHGENGRRANYSPGDYSSHPPPFAHTACLIHGTSKWIAAGGVVVDLVAAGLCNGSRTTVHVGLESNQCDSITTQINIHKTSLVE